MPKCPKCSKEVYFATATVSEEWIRRKQNNPNSVWRVATERVTSLGKDWHRPCLKCEKCNKTLSAGSHSEHEGKPYCNKPCYSALFGPKGFGHGGTESHTFN